ncbi:MAG: hypothetical protein LBS16_06245 [Prevotellaceae bacterium]|jgi:hypothetical protein|nr:hypothetical protein [Prevotellaceae bacterium]
MMKKNNEPAVIAPGEIVDENALFERVAAIIENRKARAYARVNTEHTMMFSPDKS